jgi:sec-independent protein translocase protein TatC
MTETSVARSTSATPVPENNAKKSPDEMSFLEHLEALRWHIVRALVSVVIVGVVAFMAKSYIFEVILLGPTKSDFLMYRFFCGISEKICFYPQGLEIITRDISEQFLSHIKVSIWLGLIVSFPYIFYEFWKFVKPGLYAKEQKVTKGVVFICSVLFLSGVLFGYFIIAPFAVTFLSSYSVSPEILNTTTLTSLVNSMTMFTIPTGIIFELPIVIYFLSKIGIVTADSMKQYRKHAVVVILTLSAIITPPDVITQFLIGLPLYMLFETGIIIAKRVEKNQAKENGGN